jgi:hypothetical protein
VKFTDSHIEEIKAAAERIGDHGKIIIAVHGAIMDIITEDRKRIQNGYQDSDVKQPDKSGGSIQRKQ